MRTIKRLLNVPTLVPYALSDAEKQDFEDQVRALLVDSNLPPVLVSGNGNNTDGRKVDFGIWWLIAKPKYPNVDCDSFHLSWSMCGIHSQLHERCG